MKKLRWQLLIVILALAAIGALLATRGAPSAPEGEGGAAAPAAVEPAAGGVYSEALIGAYGRLNPVLDYYNAPDHDIDRLLYCSLLRFDPYGQPYGDLAADWGVSQDGADFNFALRPDAVWHDGEPVTSADVLFTVDLLRSEASTLPADLRAFWQDVEVTAFDDHTLQFRLPEAFAPFLDYLAFGILPKHLLTQVTPASLAEDPFNLKPVGCGPYRLDGLEVEDGQIRAVRLASFANYYDRPAYISEITFRYYPDAAAALEAYRAGEVLGISHIPADLLPEALPEEDLNLYTGRLPRLSLIYFNLADNGLAFMQDADVRQALYQGLNRQWMIDNLLAGQAIPADGPIFPGTWAYYDGTPRVTFDPAAASEALRAAGWTVPAEGGTVRAKEDSRLAFELVHPDVAPFPALAEAIQRDWARLGVQVTLTAVPYETLVSDYLEPRQYQAALVDLNFARSPDPDPYPFWHQAQAKSGQNYGGWDDRQASEFLEQARVEVDAAERLRRYRNFQVRFAAELPALPLFYPVYTYGVDRTVQGVRMGPLFDPADRFNTMPDWFLNAAR